MTRLARLLACLVVCTAACWLVWTLTLGATL